MYTIHCCLFVLLIIKVIMNCSAMGLWYIDQSVVYNSVRDECKFACESTMDCPLDLSCFHASKDQQGCCLPVLKPNETGCVLNEQCSRACSTSYCSRQTRPSRCVCHSEHHFLFGKCWSACPPFAVQQAPLLADLPNVTQCLLNRDELTAELKGENKRVQRNRRQIQRSISC